jgi:LCP family protein required for cell wall assembly
MYEPPNSIKQLIPGASPHDLPELGPSRLRSRRRQRKSGLFVRRLIALGVFAGLVVCVGFAAVAALNLLFPPTVQVAGDPDARMNVLAIGIDPKPLPVEDSDKASRRLADTLMLFSLDQKANRAYVLSIPRETKATLGEAGPGVLGDALAVGGIELVKDTVEELTGLTIQHYISIDLDGARSIIRQLDAPDIYVGKPLKFAEKEPAIALDLQPGWHHLGPDDTLAYVYQRTEDEIDRLERQQMLVRTWQAQLHDAWNWLWLAQLSSRAVGAIETDLPKRDFEYMVGAWRGVKPIDITYALLPGDANARGEWIMSPRRWDALLPRLQAAPGKKDIAAAKPALEILYDDPADEKVMMLATTLQNLGFQVIRTAHYPVDQDETVVVDRMRADERSASVIAAIDQAVGGTRVEVSADETVGYAAQLSLKLGKKFFK